MLHLASETFGLIKMVTFKRSLSIVPTTFIDPVYYEAMMLAMKVRLEILDNNFI